MFNKFILFTTTSWFLASLLTIPLILWLWWYRKQTNNKKLATFQSFARLDIIMLLLFVVWFSLSFAFRLQPYGYQEFIAFTVGPLGYIVATLCNFRTWIEKFKYSIAWGLTVVSTILSLQALMQFITQHSPRLYGLFESLEASTTYPNTFALVFLLLVPFTGFLVLNPKVSLYQRLVASIALIINTAAFFLTFSRGSTFAFGAGLLVALIIGKVAWLIHTKNTQRRFSQFFVPVLLFCGLVILSFGVAFGINEIHRTMQPADLAAKVPLTEDFVHRVSQDNISATQSVDERIQFWKGSLKLIEQYPLFGIGSDGFRFQYPRVQEELLAVSTHPHNLFIKLALENGIPAGIVFLIFCLILFFSRCKEILRPVVTEKALWLGAILSSFVMAQAHHLTDYNINAVLPWLLFWLVIVMMAPSHVPSTKAQHNNKILKIILTFGLLVILIISSFFAVQYLSLKKASDFLQDTQATEALEQLRVTPMGIFDPIRYEVAGEALLQYNDPLATYHEVTLRENEQPPSLELLQQLIIMIDEGAKKYPFWAESHLSRARLFAYEQKWEPSAQEYEETFKYNSLNSLNWHVEYLTVLLNANDQKTLKTQEDYYFQLITDYEKKLRVDEHNTVGTINPAAGYAIIEIYKDLPSAQYDWKEKEKNYFVIWQEEKEKFKQIQL